MPVTRGPKKLHPLTPAEQAKLDALRPQIEHWARNGGFSARWLSERTGVGLHQVRLWINAELKGYWHGAGCTVFRMAAPAQKDRVNH